MSTMFQKKSGVGDVIEFRPSNYYVYGVILVEDKARDDTVMMFTPKYESNIKNVGDLYLTPIRCIYRFFGKLARSAKNTDILKVVGKLDVSQFNPVDLRFRNSLAGISEGAKWQITNGDQRFVVPFLTIETAMLSDDGVPNMDYIREYYDSDFYPWSSELVSRGAIDFDAEEHERVQRRGLALLSSKRLS